MTAFDRVKELCKKRGIPVSKLESDVGFGKNSIYSWKQNNPSSDKLQKIADYFNVSTDYLLGRTDNPQIDSDIPPEAATLAAHIDPAATEEDMKKILEYIDFIQQKYK
ncbi:XRE family transcriptional regulator [Listeria monocytogenes]|nr:XRE family transcriptional regulator [Listeria monocytogenes]EAF4223212.1 XRE family transcriptional regulator [Listeria monocytogenes]EAF4229289.1 XRE family transcriptional regulator [Listeria monocytogenes]EAF4232444.1 XRE family transcriptional regulator [Listeria monocytogenes]EAF4238527.1 XRE family transcriptional regulator [Listeria monocytogenes]